jgi:DNA polymerase-3 subunit epsilon
VWTDGRGLLARHVLLVDPGRDIPAEASAIHGISSERARDDGVPLEYAARFVHSSLAKASAEGIPIVAMNASFDLTIAECLFERFALGSVSWDRVVDPLVIDRYADRYRKGKRRLDALCETYGVLLEAAHDAGNDAEAAVLLARAIGRTWPEVSALDILDLTRRQQGWHESWAVGYHQWCLSEGQPGLDAGDFRWPVRLPRDRVRQDVSEPRTMSMSSSLERGFTIASRMATSP